MPIYEYTCPKCGYQIEMFERKMETVGKVECVCGHKMKKIMSTTGKPVIH